MTKHDSSVHKSGPGPSDANAQRTLRLVMLAVAVCLVAAGVIVAFRPTTPDTTPTKPQPPSDSQRVQEQARKLMQNGLHKPAIDLLTTYTRANPNDVDAQLLRAQALSDVGQYDQAEQSVDKIFLSLQAPLKAQLHWLKGELVRRRLNDPKKYMPHFESAVNQPDVTPELWSRYGQLLERDRPRWRDADPPSPDPEQEARDWCQRAYDAGLRDAATLRVLGKFALDNDEFDRALELLEAAVEKEKNNPELWLLLVQTFRQMGRDDQALAAVQTALQGRPDGELWLELGQLREARGEKQQAADAFAEAAGYRNAAMEASLAAARLYHDLGHYARAMRYIDQARPLWGDDPDVAALQKKIEDARFVAK